MNKQRWTLVATILATGIVFLDSTVVNVALPAVDRQLDAGLSGLQWIVDGYVLALAALLIPGGALGDRYGRRRVMVTGLIGFGLASAACGLAPSIGWLIAARLLQGVAGALMVPGSLALLRAAFPEGEEQGRAVGHWAGWSGITTVIGPLVGGWLVQTFSWRWVFFLSVPVVAVAVWMMVAHVPDSRAAGQARRVDWPGALLVAAGLAGLAYGLIEGPVVGWGAPAIVGALACGALALALFVLVEARVADPMVPLDLFRARNFAGANLATLGVYLALSGMTFFLVIYVQNIMGYSPLQAGLVLAPLSALMLVLSPRMGGLAGRYGARLFMTAGAVLCAAGLLLLLRLGPDSSYWTALLPAIVVFGLGLATTVAPLTDTVISSVPEDYTGVAAAINNAVSRVATLLAVAGLGVVVTLTFRAALVDGVADLKLSPQARQVIDQAREDPTGAVDRDVLPDEAAAAVDRGYTEAFHRAMVVSAASAALGGVAAFALVRRQTGSTAGS